jgi:RsiW-degrading membrane proteinase PrsW (M82 family)
MCFYYRIVGAPPPWVVVCCVVIGCVTVASRVVVVVVVVGSDEHEAKLSIAAIPNKNINIFIREFLLLNSAQLPQTDV